MQQKGIQVIKGMYVKDQVIRKGIRKGIIKGIQVKDNKYYDDKYYDDKRPIVRKTRMEANSFSYFLP